MIKKLLIIIGLWKHKPLENLSNSLLPQNWRESHLP